MKQSRIMVYGCLALFVTACGQSRGTDPSSATKEAWDHRNDPIHLKRDYTVALNALPTEGIAEQKPWSDSYWPSYQGGLSYRWNDEYEDGFSYQLPSQSMVRHMNEEELARLSPAEKYDILTGNYEFPLVKYERQRTSPKSEPWFGLCHGWAPAAINFQEPNPVVIKSAGGISIPFGSSDIKALLTFAQQFNRENGATRFLGGRCNDNIRRDPAAATKPQCRDVNAGSFHIVVANQLGLLKRAFVADITRDYEVWNQPVHSFQSEIVSFSDRVYPGAAPGTVRTAKVRTYLTYTVEVSPSWERTSDNEQVLQDRTELYEYTLELNRHGEIIGGEWQSDDRPDFLWMQSPPPFTGHFQELGRLYRASIQQ